MTYQTTLQFLTNKISGLLSAIKVSTMGTIKNIFDVSGRAMAAQMIRLNTVASNLANSNNISSTSEGAYRPLKPIFKTILFR